MKLSLSSSEFKNTLKVSKSLNIGDLLFKFTPSPTPGFGLIVSRNYGNAVQRNLFKRRCRSEFRQLISASDNACSVIIRPKKSHITYSEISNAFTTLQGRICN